MSSTLVMVVVSLSNVNECFSSPQYYQLKNQTKMWFDIYP